MALAPLPPAQKKTQNVGHRASSDGQRNVEIGFLAGKG